MMSVILGNDTSLYLQDYIPSDAVAAFHTLPRFSHHDDFSAVFSTDSDEVEDYTKGLLFIACLVGSFFTLWGLILLLLKCLGPDRVGVFSGYPYQQDGVKSTIGRCIFLFSAFMVFIFSILTVTKGLSELAETTDTIKYVNMDVLKIHDAFSEISANLKLVSREATPVRDEMVTFLTKDVCPLQPKSDLEIQIREVGTQTLSSLVTLSDFINKELDTLDGTLRTVRKATDEVSEAVDGLNFTRGGVAALMIPFYLIPVLLIVTLMMGWTNTYYEGYYIFTTWFLMPLFVLMIMAAYIACFFILIGTEGNADFCAGGVDDTPESSIQNIMTRQSLEAGSYYHDAMIFYSNQCQVEGPWGFLEQYQVDLISAQASLESFASIIADVSPDHLSQECGVDYRPALQLIKQLQTYTSILANSSMRSLNLLSCDNIVPLYTSTVYDGTCEQSVTAGAWLFGASFVISFFGMMLIMFRGAYYPTYYWDGKDSYSTSSSMEDLELEEDDSNEEFDDEAGTQYTGNGAQEPNGSLFSSTREP